MHRTQIQLPEPLFDEVKRVAALEDWSISETLRRAAEVLVLRYPEIKTRQKHWEPPEPLELGVFRCDPADFRSLDDEESRHMPDALR